MKKYKKESICQTCFNFGCDWHLYFQPVDGWTAEPTVLREGLNRDGSRRTVESYHVTACPLYKEREVNWVRRVLLKEMCKDLGVCWETMRRWLRDPGHYESGANRVRDFYHDKGYYLLTRRRNKHNAYYLVRLDTPRFVLKELLHPQKGDKIL